MANDRYKSEVALDNSRRTSREAKRRRTGSCVDCGTVTRYHGHGRGVSERCPSCASVLREQARRGTGPAEVLVLRLLEQGPQRFSELRDQMGTYNGYMGQLLIRLLRYGLIVRLRRGVYALPEEKS